MIIKRFKKAIVTFSIAGIILTSAGTSHAALGDRILSKHGDHPDVEILQGELKALGYFTDDKTSTYYGNSTEAAVKKFQTDQGLYPSGQFDKTTFASIKTLRKSPIEFTRQLQVKSEGPDVKELQERLKHLGHMDIKNTTEYYGTVTQNAVKSFQESHKLNPDGIVNARTIDILNDVLLGRVPNHLPSRGGSTEGQGANIANTARQFLGYRYVFGAAGPNAFDCSGFTSYVYSQYGISIPRTTSGQASAGTWVSKDQLQPGDLLIFSNTYKAGPSHVGVYIGNGEFIHSSTPKTGVIKSNLNTSYYQKHFASGRRVF